MDATTLLAGEDLLRPTLTERDDFEGFDHPWNPWTLLVIGVLLGPYSAGILYGWNFRRLGDTWGRVAIFGLGFLALGVGDTTVRILVDRSVEPLAYRLGTTGLAVLGALVATAFQKRRHQLFVNCEGKSGGLFKALVIAFLAGAAVTMPCALLLKSLLGEA